jgi:probable F420-dependent oxidoreductase
MDLNERLTTPGVWFFPDLLDAGRTRELAQRLESLGYSALWIPDTLGRDPFVTATLMLEATTELVVATGIANIHMRHPGMMKQGANAVAELSGGRFVLGIGVSHAPLVEGIRKLSYDKPLTTMRRYLDAMEESMYFAAAPAQEPPVVLAALGPKMLELAAERTRGAHPYWTTPAHTAQAREIMGPDAWLCVEQKCVLTTVSEVAHDVTNRQLGTYADLPNYRNNWKRLGFSEDEIANRDTRFLDAVMAWGDEAAIAQRVQEHYDAGASHVCIQPIDPAQSNEPDWRVLEALAPRQP